MWPARVGQNSVKSLSARRAWIEIVPESDGCLAVQVALRKESVDRNRIRKTIENALRQVALRKESVDRNPIDVLAVSAIPVALRKESVDRNAE